MRLFSSITKEGTPFQRYMVAVVAIVLAVLLRAAFQPIFGFNQTFLFSTLAIIALAIYVGLGPALLGLALSVIINVPLFMSPWHSWKLLGDEVVSVISYTLVAMVIINLAHRQRKARDEAQQSADEVLRLNYELEERVAARTSELKEANQELAGMTYSIAHDMRQYLRGINVAAYTVVEDNQERLDEDGRASLQSLRRNARQANDLVEGLLEFSRLGKNELRRSTVNVNELCEGIRSLLQKNEKGLPVHLKVDAELTAFADQHLLEIVLQNLMENAVKYRKKGTEPRLEIGQTSADGGQVYFVKDDGIGFDMKYLDHIFLPFERLHRAVEYPGTGIGLASVKKIIEKHGGRIWAESAPGEGSTFFFTLSQATKGLRKAA